MLVGVMSDSHDYIRGVRLAAQKFKEYGVELVVHLGDIVAPFTLRAMREANIREAVLLLGNNDGEKRLLAEVAAKLGYKLYEPPVVLELGGRRVLAIHGVGSEEETLRIVYSVAPAFDAVLYGHTHNARVEERGGTLILNPGETCGCLTGRMSVAILDTKRLSATLQELGSREDHL